MCMHVCMHVCDNELVFFFIQLVKGWEGYQEFLYSGADLSFSISQSLRDPPLSRQKGLSLALYFLELGGG